MRTTSLLLLAALGTGCLNRDIVGADDAGDASLTDTPAPRDVAPGVDSSDPPGRDAGGGDDVPVARDTGGGGDSGGGGPVTNVLVSASNGTGPLFGPFTDVVVGLFGSAPPDETAVSATPVATSGPCSAYAPVPLEPAWPAAIDGVTVTVAIDGGAAQAMTYQAASHGYLLELASSVADGHTAVVHVAARDGVVPELTIPIQFPTVTVHTPTVAWDTSTGTMVRRAHYAVGSDLALGWSASSLGDTNAGMRIVFVDNPLMPTRSIVCTATPSSGALTVPWTFLTQWVPPPGYGSAVPGIDGVELFADYIRTIDSTQSGVAVRTEGAAVDISYLNSR